MMQGLQVVILAAGSGTRMRSAKPKVLHTVLGKPMLQHVIEAAQSLKPKCIWVIYGQEGAPLQQVMKQADLNWVEQTPPLGTGHALQVLLPHLQKNTQDKDKILILSADGPAITSDTLQNLIQNAYAPLVLLNVILSDPTGFGRIKRNQHDAIMGIVEQKDATPDELQITEIYSGIMLIEFSVLKILLPQLTNQNKQNEFYLTQMVSLAQKDGVAIQAVLAGDPVEVKGVNDRAQLAELERSMQFRQAKRYMLAGVTLLDPHRFDVRGALHAEMDVVIDVNCIIEGEVFIGSGTTIGAHCILKNCHIAKNVQIQPYSYIDGATIAEGAVVGPFARIRPGTIIQENAQIGNFIEIKNTSIGKNTKAHHVGYLGDGVIGEEVNIGAGTIFCNYDGANKHITHVENGAFIGSNASLVAPVKIGENATIGAGSTITREAPADQLTLGRARQISVVKWRRPTRK